MIQNVKAIIKIQKNRVIYLLSLVNTVVCMKLYTISDSHVKIPKFCTLTYNTFLAVQDSSLGDLVSE